MTVCPSEAKDLGNHWFYIVGGLSIASYGETPRDKRDQADSRFKK